MKKTILPFVIMSIITLFTACDHPTYEYYCKYSYTIILMKANTPIDTLCNVSRIPCEKDDNPNFVSDTFWLSKEYLLNRFDSIANVYENDNTGYDHSNTELFLPDSIGCCFRKYLNVVGPEYIDKYLAFITLKEYRAIKKSDCDSVAISFKGENIEEYECTTQIRLFNSNKL
ncbi:MAG: hypothetical protein J6W13_08685 [Salinivirgaceae bacterium]|nr:hypothetical protein [Salinivirgaceae bacterium]